MIRQNSERQETMALIHDIYRKTIFSLKQRKQVGERQRK